MSEPILVISADCHLAQRAWSRHPSLEGDSYFGLQQLVDYASDHGLDLVLAGDIFDKTRPDPVTVYHMREKLDQLCQAVYFIQGQHELDRTKPWLNSISRWPEHINKKTKSISDINIYGLDWTPADSVQQEFSLIPSSTNILIAHQVWRDLMGPRIGESECQFSDVPYVSMIVTGDFHRHLQMGAINRQGKYITAVSPGPTCMQSIDEDPHKQFFVLNDDLTVHSRPLITRQCFRCVINSKDDVDLFLSINLEQVCTPQSGVPDSIAKNIVHITYQDEIPEVYSRITSAINNRAHLFLVPVKHKPEEMAIETDKRRALADGGLAACLQLVTPPSTPIYRDILTLLKSNDPKLQLADMKVNFLKERQ